MLFKPWVGRGARLITAFFKPCPFWKSSANFYNLWLIRGQIGAWVGKGLAHDSVLGKTENWRPLLNVFYFFCYTFCLENFLTYLKVERSVQWPFIQRQLLGLCKSFLFYYFFLEIIWSRYQRSYPFTHKYSSPCAWKDAPMGLTCPSTKGEMKWSRYFLFP